MALSIIYLYCSPSHLIEIPVEWWTQKNVLMRDGSFRPVRNVAKVSRSCLLKFRPVHGKNIILGAIDVRCLGGKSLTTLRKATPRPNARLLSDQKFVYNRSPAKMKCRSTVQRGEVLSQDTVV